MPLYPYIFTSERLGFRNWQAADLEPMAAINADPEVMEFFPSVQSQAQTYDFIGRMQRMFAERDYCYFAVDRLDTGEFIGFTGLAWQSYEADFTPCTDIGWRLKRSAWGHGFASEAARRCLDYGFQDLRLDRILAVAPKLNTRSEQVMKKIGMTKCGDFLHPLLKNDPRLEECVLYEIVKGG